MKKSGQVLSYSQEASYWEAALPLGNGRIGAMVYGGAEQIRDRVQGGYPAGSFGERRSGG